MTVTYEEYKAITEKIGDGEHLTEEETLKMRHYECFMQDIKLGRTHEDAHIQD